MMLLCLWPSLVSTPRLTVFDAFSHTAALSLSTIAMVKPLTFKGDKKVKKRKHRDRDRDGGDGARKRAALEAGSAVALVQDESVAEDDSWVSAEALGDVAGPVMIVLPSVANSDATAAAASATAARPTALASDANGKVFALPIENIVDGNPASAEPHDVRQVWVANRIAGTEHFRFKGHHDKYLGCDKYGLLSATSIAVSPLESFALVAAGEGEDPATFQIKTLRDTFLAVSSSASGGAGSHSKAAAGSDTAVPDVRGDATEASLSTTVRIRMQARFKPRIKASKEERARERIGRRELEGAVGRRLEDDEVKLLKRARREGDYHEKLLDMKVKGKHDKFA